MGCNARVMLFFGVVLKPDALPPYQEGTVEEGAAWLAYSGQSENGVRVTPTGHHDVPRLAVYLSGTMKKGSDWSAMRAGDGLYRMSPEIAEQIDAFLGKYNLRSVVDVGPPQWLVAPYYG